MAEGSNFDYLFKVRFRRVLRTVGEHEALIGRCPFLVYRLSLSETLASVNRTWQYLVSIRTLTRALCPS